MPAISVSEASSRSRFTVIPSAIARTSPLGSSASTLMLAGMRVHQPIHTPPVPDVPPEVPAQAGKLTERTLPHQRKIPFAGSNHDGL